MAGGNTGHPRVSTLRLPLLDGTYRTAPLAHSASLAPPMSMHAMPLQVPCSARAAADQGDGWQAPTRALPPLAELVPDDAAELLGSHGGAAAASSETAAVHRPVHLTGETRWRDAAHSRSKVQQRRDLHQVAGRSVA